MGAKPEVDRLVETGQFADALRELGDVRRRPESHRPERVAVLAEVLLQTGPIEEAVNVAKLVLRSGLITPSLASRCLYVLGRALFRTGQSRESHQRLGEAVRLAESVGDLRRLCNAKLGILATSSDHWPVEAIAAFSQALHREVLQLGEPGLLLQLHIDMARLEALRGRISAAQRHIDLAKELLPLEPSLLSRANLILIEAAVCTLRSDYHRSIRLAEDGLTLAERAGSQFVAAQATGLLAENLLQLGNLNLAEARVREGMRATSEIPRWTQPQLDTLALILIGKCRWAEAQEAIEVAEALVALEPDWLASWNRVDSLRTTARLALRQSDWSRAATVASEAARLAEQRGDSLYTSLHRVSLAEAKLKSGEDADVELAALLESTDDSVPKLRVDLERIKGLAVSASAGSTFAAFQHLERTLALKASISDSYTRVDAVEDFIRLLAKLPEFSGLGEGPEILNLEQFPRLPVRVSWHRDTCTNPASGTDSGPTHAISRFAALLGLSGQADALARECIDLLIEADCSGNAALVVRGEGADPHVWMSHGWDLSTAQKKARNPGSCAVIDLGQWRGATYHLIVEPRDDVSSRITLASIRKIVSAALQLEKYRREEKERAALWPVEDLTDDADGVFVSTEMLDIVNTARRVAPTTLPVLLTGETGTGKEILARVIHKASPRADKVFSALNCTAVPRDMLDSQLFGYRRGAFTGAQDGFTGVIRGAAGGTLFLDEIAEIGLDLQPKLLRFLETGEIHPLGEAHPVKVDVRIIAATNANLDRMVGEGRFREDLLYRLNVIRFRIPPLRERREEIPQLVQHFLRRHADEFKKGRPRATDETMEYLLLFGWPGNVRQLANELRRVVALIEPDGEITPAHLSTEIRASRRTVPVEERLATDEVVVRLDQPLATVLDSIERLMVGRALEQAGGKVEHAAARLGISRKGLFLKRKRWGMQPGREG